MANKLEAVRAALADYMLSEGCSCCQNTEKHKEAERVLAGLLDVPMYDDGSGYDFFQFEGDEELIAKMKAFNKMKGKK